MQVTIIKKNCDGDENKSGIKCITYKSIFSESNKIDGFSIKKQNKPK